MSQVTYNTTQIKLAVARIKKLSADLEKEIQDIEKQVEPYIASWSGDGQTAYRMLKVQWNGKQKNIRDVLYQLAVVVDKADDNMVNTDKSIADWFNKG